jgi:hypothetical protein
MDNRALISGTVANKFQTAVHRPDPRNPRLQLNGLVLIVQANDPLAAGYDVTREFEPHPLDADVGAATGQCLICYAELSRKVN